MKSQINQYFDSTFEAKPPQNYESYFVPAIGEPVAIDLIQKANLKHGDRVLDVACGTGIIARLALKYVGDTGSITGTDINAGMLEVAKSKTKDTPIVWQHANAEELPLPADSFDVVLCQMGLQFMADPLKALKEMNRVLVPGGRLLINVPGPAAEPFDILAKSMERNISVQAKGFVQRVFAISETRELKQMITDADFKEVDAEVTIKTLTLPEPKNFLWQYVNSTPLAMLLAETDEETRITIENEVVGQWNKFKKGGKFIYKQRMITATARK